MSVICSKSLLILRDQLSIENRALCVAPNWCINGLLAWCCLHVIVVHTGLLKLQIYLEQLEPKNGQKNRLFFSETKFSCS